MAAGSYIRFFVGLALSVTVLAAYMGNDKIPLFAALLALFYIILTALWVAFRF